MSRLIDRLSAAALQRARVASAETAETDEATIQPVREDTRPSLPSGFVRRVLEMRDSVPEPNRRGLPGYLHVSSLSTVCTRQWLLMQDMGLQTSDRTTGGHRVMWAIGRAVEEHIRGQLIDGYPRGVFGEWVCPCEDTTHRGHKPAPDNTCERCGGTLHFYREMTLVDHEYGVTGNPDMVLREGDAYVPVEIKSMNKAEFDELKQPKPAHVVQVLGYRKLLRANGRPVHNDAVIVYCTKDFKWGSPYKEFHVNGATQQNEAMLEELFLKAKEVKEHREAGTLSPREHCSNITSRRAKACPVSGACFARRST